MLFEQSKTSKAFLQWLGQNKENKRLIMFSVAVMIVSFGWLKFIYPYPNFMPPDSYFYIDTAHNNEFINIWPIGYSKFLRLVSVFTRSHLLLVVLQYLLLMTSVLYLLFTIRYLLSPGKWLFRCVLTLSIMNPLLPHIANFISSDCLFAAISLVWFTQLLWIIHQPGLRLLLIHAVILFLAFIVRHSAIWYPFISIVLIILAGPIPKKLKLLSIVFIIAPLLIFIGCTQYEYYKKTGIIQYSPFGSWQMAANVLYGYAYAQPDEPSKLPFRFRDLHIMVNRHMDSLRTLLNRPDQEIGVYYFWDYKSPLFRYMKYKQPKKPYFEQWAAMGPLYGAYGRWLIVQHPGLFLKHFVWPNLMRYYSPPAYFMGVYNMGFTNVDTIAVTWFKWKNDQLPTRLSDRKIHLMLFFPTVLAIINLLFAISALCFAYFVGLKQCNPTSIHIFSCMLSVWLVNCIFSIVSAPIELRYQIFPTVITLPLFIFFISGVIQSWQPSSATSLV